MSRNELYGYLHPATREWREGIISVTFRDMANNKTNKHQWIVLDGDIDAEWIEVGPAPLWRLGRYTIFPALFVLRSCRRSV